MRHINLGNPPSFFYTPTWSPDSKKIAYTDKRLQLWYIDLDNPKPKLIDADYFGGFGPTQLSQTWSPDSKWIAYTKQLPSGLHALFVYSLEQGKFSQVTDGMSDVLYPSFDKNGKYLYFTASTNTGLSPAGLDMSSDEHRVTRSVYVAVLSKDEKSPLAPESDEENKPKDEKKPDADKDKPAADKDRGKDADKDKDKDKDKDDKDKDAKDKGKKEEPVVVKIDIEGIGQRILSLPIPAKNYSNMLSGKSGILFLAEGAAGRHRRGLSQHQSDDPEVRSEQAQGRQTDRRSQRLCCFLRWRKDSLPQGRSLDDRRRPTMVRRVEAPVAAGQPKPGFGPLKLDGWEVYVEPRAMWKQIYNETWRIERDFFYDPHYHGLDLDKAKKKYAPYLDGIASRDESLIYSRNVWAR